MRFLSTWSLLTALLPLLLVACSTSRASGGAPDAPNAPETPEMPDTPDASDAPDTPDGEAKASPWPDAAGAIADPDLAALATGLWEEMLRADPVFASQLGDERYLGQVKDLSPGALKRRRPGPAPAGRSGSRAGRPAGR